MKIYIASSWKNESAVRLVTRELRKAGHEVFSFVEASGDEEVDVINGKMSFDEWLESPQGRKKFELDTGKIRWADAVVYLGPAGTDAWAEVGFAYGMGKNIWGVWSKGEPAGLMRKMVDWARNVDDLLEFLPSSQIPGPLSAVPTGEK